MPTAVETRELLKQHFAALKDEIEERKAALAPLRAERDALVAQMQPLEDQARELAQQIKQLSPELYDLEMEFSALAKTLGGKRLSDGVAAQQAEQNEAGAATTGE